MSTYFDADAAKQYVGWVGRSDTRRSGRYPNKGAT
jgi:hypothetical protein